MLSLFELSYEFLSSLRVKIEKIAADLKEVL